MKEQSFAKELLSDMKKQNKRMFIALITVISLWFVTIAGFVYYLYNYETVVTTDDYEYTTDVETNGDGDINIGGDIING